MVSKKSTLTNQVVLYASWIPAKEDNNYTLQWAVQNL